MPSTALPMRKHPRLKSYDYSDNGFYFVTICAKDMKCIFGNAEPKCVGRGLAPAVTENSDMQIVLSQYGIIAEQQLFALENRYDFVRIDKFIIMPNHIHAILTFNGKTAGASPRPTLSDVICAYKSITTRLCNRFSNVSERQIFQTSFYDSVIRNEAEYLNIWQYIDENPKKWKNDEYYK